ncbi:MAG: cupin domain-containing protein [Candidatus Dormibacteraeota bacterium]|uniref:Cupin domain-containing protein n=1 Tax=Candidatus Dormiibacter inghamiae TaxID=3127013 RepID=A0A934NER4_9BACT|nr:cupin domain-containing protein [Candidatus Dormibacteraeota bacterium]MBJ7606196.1 cupin domain-containing protein [Candidatus Dormibacteraeota bacterium]
MADGKSHFMTTIDDVAPQPVRAEQGWVGMDIRFPLPPEVADEARVALFRALFPPGSQHSAHIHPNADEFFYVIRGRAEIGSGDESHQVGAGTVEFVRRGAVHWLRNLDSREEVEVFGGYLGVANLQEAGYEYVGKAGNQRQT